MSREPGFRIGSATSKFSAEKSRSEHSAGRFSKIIFHCPCNIVSALAIKKRGFTIKGSTSRNKGDWICNKKGFSALLHNEKLKANFLRWRLQSTENISTPPSRRRRPASLRYRETRIPEQVRKPGSTE